MASTAHLRQVLLTFILSLLAWPNSQLRTKYNLLESLVGIAPGPCTQVGHMAVDDCGNFYTSDLVFESNGKNLRLVDKGFRSPICDMVFDFHKKVLVVR